MTFVELIAGMRTSMTKAVEHTLVEFNSLHTGKASPSLVENLQVQVTSYGTSMHLRDISAITTPDPRTIQIQPWDKNVVSDIEKAIQLAKLGLNPAVAGTVIRIPIPELSGERRQELKKVAQQIAEEGRVSVRHVRRETMEALKTMQKDGDISEDDLRRNEKDVQSETDKYIEQIAEHLTDKEEELMTV
ncbi:MAG: Ribosome-recycling factor [Candidatus Moanabacter tarae]|uniref:Ribosome-recycling factor n=1 Tax=Candidatus Moanibacter tarae TaxID=2200854 RepID=A0A2Z4AE50_9BACT|nr:MAG: Ribosome-recycling factor [Candidatus Moanabacter tarae]|tara:strand:+ start:51277 stop:51843 length:567 start_codon:yes stop_codon:yes gene_type:complete